MTDEIQSYYLRHKNKILQYQKQYVRANREKVREYQQRYFVTRYANSRKKQEMKDNQTKLFKSGPVKKLKHNEYCREYMRKKTHATKEYKKIHKDIEMKSKTNNKKKEIVLLKYPIKKCYTDDGDWFILHLDN